MRNQNSTTYKVNIITLHSIPTHTLQLNVNKHTNYIHPVPVVTGITNHNYRDDCEKMGIVDYLATSKGSFITTMIKSMALWF